MLHAYNSIVSSIVADTLCFSNYLHKESEIKKKLTKLVITIEIPKKCTLIKHLADLTRMSDPY